MWFQDLFKNIYVNAIKLNSIYIFITVEKIEEKKKKKANITNCALSKISLLFTYGLEIQI